MSDADNDSIDVLFSIDDQVDANSPYTLNNQNSLQSIIIDTTAISIGINNIQVQIYDMFHISTPARINITLNVTFDPNPYFTESLSTNLSFPIWTQSIVELPSVQDLDNDFNKVQLYDSSDWVQVQALTLVLSPTASELSTKSILIELVDLK